ncbi:MAG: DUF885 domain-containing protein [Bifidobacteriaceae bacterium]|jgi:uncharacterized protein (DUF885 family)|nr:DUF885 domain-containing protein [Bifidobacteriaceae bacterium]
MKDSDKTPIDKLCEEYLAGEFKLSPIFASVVGKEELSQDPDGLDDFSPATAQKHLALMKDIKAKAEKVELINRTDEIIQRQLLSIIDTQTIIYEKFQDHLRSVNNLATPLQDVRMLFERLPRGTVEEMTKIGRKLANVAKSIDSFRASLEVGLSKNIMPAKRQVKALAKQAADLADPQESYYQQIANEAKALVPEQAEAFQASADAAIAAHQKLVEFLQGEYYDQAVDQDAVGEERYQVYAFQFSGKKLDLQATYEWGVSEVERLVDEQNQIAQRVLGLDTRATDFFEKIIQNREASKKLDSDPKQQLQSKDELLGYMKETSKTAMSFLIDNHHFDIPEPVRTLECQIAPSNDGEIYYTEPTDGFTIPGTMWWSIPNDVNKFYKWREKTTIHHEGVPGHHLQLGIQVYNAAKINDWRRLGLFLSGYGEGWALYAEQLMDEFGFLDDADRFGMLDGQLMRAARIVIDIGTHCQKPVPASWQARYGAGIWDWDKCFKLLDDTTAMNEGFRLFELTRYFGWPGQAISYKLGQRAFLELRDQAIAKGWTLNEYHKRVLDLGTLGLDNLEFALFG